MIFRYYEFFRNDYTLPRPAITARNGHLSDNIGHIFASMDMEVVPGTVRWIPYKTDSIIPDDRAIVWNGRVYWMRTLCDELGSWKRRGFFDDYMESTFIDLLSYLFLDVYAWDMEYCFPCVKNETSGRLDTGSIISFLEQFESDPHEPEVIDGSHSIATWSLSDMTPGWLDEPVDSNFLWEYDMEAITDE